MKMKMLRTMGCFLLMSILFLCACSQENPDEPDTPQEQTENNLPKENEAVLPEEKEPIEKEPAEKEPEKKEIIDFASLDTTTTSLKDQYADEFMIGTIYTTNITRGDDKDVVLRNFNAITPENIMKPSYVQPTEGKFNYSDINQMMLFGTGNELSIIGHTLAWHQQSGNWLGIDVDRETAIEQLKSHITNLVTQYKGMMYSIDVVNEAINDGARLPADGDWTTCLRKSQWYNSIGPDYIAMAFQFAHEADPDLKLYYNDYNLDNRAKARIVNAMVEDFIEQGIPIHGIGMQGHYNTKTNISFVKSSLEMFSALEGIEVAITELDVCVNNAGSTLSEESEIEQAIVYAKLFQVFKEYSDVISRVTFWGYRDNTSWRKDQFPLLFDKSLNAKESYLAVLYPDEYLEYREALEEAEKAASVKNRAEAIYGTPVIDGTVDDTWSSCTAYPVNIMLTAWQGASGTVKTMWDDNCFYALFEVKDSVLNKSSVNAYEQDSIELFLNQKSGGSGEYDGFAGQYRVNYEGELSFGEVPSEEGVTAAAKKTDGGYIVEIAVPFIEKGTLGAVLGFDAQINDSNASGTRQSIAKFNDNTDNSYVSTEKWGEVQLKNK